MASTVSQRPSPCSSSCACSLADGADSSLPSTAPTSPPSSMAPLNEKEASTIHDCSTCEHASPVSTSLLSPPKATLTGWHSPTGTRRTLDHIHSTYEAAVTCPRASCVNYIPLLTLHQAPEWMIDNRNLLTGYRVNLGWRKSCRSACHLHNETVNVWSHLIGFLVVFTLLVLTLAFLSPHGIDRLSVVVPARAYRGVCLPRSHSPFHCFSDEFAQLPFATLSSEAGDGSMSQMVAAKVEAVRTVLSHLREKADTLNVRIHDRGNHIRVVLSDKFYDYLSHIESQLHLRQLTQLSVDGVHSARDSIQANTRALMAYLERTADQSSLDVHAFTTHLLHGFMSYHADASSSTEASATSSSNAHSQAPASASSPTEDNATTSSAAVVSSSASSPAATTAGLTLASATAATAASATGGMRHGAAIAAGAAHSTLSQGFLLFLPVWPITVFMVTAMLCLLFSAVFHLFSAVSEPIADQLHTLDFAGICLLIAGSNVPILYYGWFCSPTLQTIYVGGVCALAVVVFIIITAPRFRGHEYKVLRTLSFIALGCSGVLPLIHLMVHMGEIHFIFWYLLAMGALYISGAMIYMFQIPERWLPGKFDIWFSSHQIWHAFIFVAIVVHTVGSHALFEWRITRQCDLVPS